MRIFLYFLIAFFSISSWAFACAYFSTSSWAFDCKKAKSATEKAICNNIVLIACDNEMSQVYSKYIHSVTKSKRQKIIEAQKSWIHKREKTCTDDPDCIKSWTQAKTEELKNLLKDTQYETIESKWEGSWMWEKSSDEETSDEETSDEETSDEETSDEEIADNETSDDETNDDEAYSNPAGNYFGDVSISNCDKSICHFSLNEGDAASLCEIEGKIKISKGKAIFVQDVFDFESDETSKSKKAHTQCKIILTFLDKDSGNINISNNGNCDSLCGHRGFRADGPHYRYL